MQAAVKEHCVHDLYVRQKMHASAPGYGSVRHTYRKVKLPIARSRIRICAVIKLILDLLHY